jgi:hypothetical protein
MIRLRKATSLRFGGIALISVFGLLGGCSLSTENPTPTSARITVTGSGTTPLELVVSTDFFEQIIGEGTEITAVIVTADTFSIDLPFEQTTALDDLGNVLYRLIQADSTPSNVTMQVFVDDNLEYNQDAAISQGASLEFRFLFRPR